jgi:hypothetical protein
MHKAAQPSKADANAALEALFRLISRTLSDFRKSASLTSLLKVFKSFDRLRSDFSKSNERLGKVEAWLPIPPIPGSIQWGEAAYETFPDICLKEKRRQRTRKKRN